jgi:hypothetical protein
MVDDKQLKVQSNTNWNRKLWYIITCICLVGKWIHSVWLNKHPVFAEDCFAFEAALMTFIFLYLKMEYYHKMSYDYLVTDCDWLTSFLELSPTWEAASCAATQEFPNFLWNTKVYYRAHNSPPLARILSHINPIHTTSFYFWKFYFNLFSHLRLGLPSGLIPSWFPTNIL